MSHPAHIEALVHASSNVECGLIPGRGRGFQLVGLSPGLAGTADLRELEDLAAYYEVSAERRAAGDLPVKATFCRLPSGRIALGRTVDWGAGPGGRPGNYLTRHLIFAEPDLATAGGPFAVDPAVWEGAAAVDPDEPREISPIRVGTRPAPRELPTLRSVRSSLLTALTAFALQPGDRSALLVGDETRSLALLHELFAALPLQERMRLTFSTHFYRACEPLRKHFRIATVRSWSEAPSQKQTYQAFDLELGDHPTAASHPYALWLSEAVQAGNDAEIREVVRVVEALRSESDAPAGALSASPGAFAAVWSLVGQKAAPLSPRGAAAIVEVLRLIKEPRDLADQLLESAPRDLCGADTSPELARACLSALRDAASPRVWKEWLGKWSGDPLLEGFRSPAWAFWKR